MAFELLLTSDVGGEASERIGIVAERFVRFANNGFGVLDIADVTVAMAEQFVRAPGPTGSPASVSMMHMRRTTLRLLFRLAREASLVDGDPTLDVRLPPRSPLAARPLTDDEVALCRAHSWSSISARRSAAWALGEATCRSRELAAIRVGDVDLDTGRVWISGGRQTQPRWGALTGWGLGQLERRIAELQGDADAGVVYAAADGSRSGQVSACLAIDDVLARAGLDREPDVRPASLAAWAGRRILTEQRRVEVVARRLGMASLDRAARFIGWDWATEPDSR
jgi:integrase/recombinase XerC